MRRNLHSLDVQKLMETEYKSISCQIKENGSDLSRALLAYYYAILNTMAAYSSTIACPIVIDSPLQDEQDEQNIRRILEFKEDAVVLNGVEFKNANCLFVDNKYAALNKEEYPRLFEELKAYMAMYLANLMYFFEVQGIHRDEMLPAELWNFITQNLIKKMKEQ